MTSKPPTERAKARTARAPERGLGPPIWCPESSASGHGRGPPALAGAKPDARVRRGKGHMIKVNKGGPKEGGLHIGQHEGLNM